MPGDAQQDDDQLMSSINETPWVDILLELLIVLIVSSSYLVNKAINVELPKAATGEATTPTMSISIDLNGKLFLDGSPIVAPELQSRVHDAYQKDPEVKAIISADGRVRHAEVVSVIDLLRREK